MCSSKFIKNETTIIFYSCFGFDTLDWAHFKLTINKPEFIRINFLLQHDYSNCNFLFKMMILIFLSKHLIYKKNLALVTFIFKFCSKIKLLFSVDTTLSIYLL